MISAPGLPRGDPPMANGPYILQIWVPVAGRQRWRVGPVCKTGALRLSEFESHVSHKNASKAYMVMYLTCNQVKLIRVQLEAQE